MRASAWRGVTVCVMDDDDDDGGGDGGDGGDGAVNDTYVRLTPTKFDRRSSSAASAAITTIPSADARDIVGDKGVNDSPHASQRSLVIVYGLSADPPTDVGGHGAVVRALRRRQDTREVVIAPVFSHAYAHKREAMTTATTPTSGRSASYAERLDMCTLAFDGAEMEVEDALSRDSRSSSPTKKTTSEERLSRVLISKCEARAAEVVQHKNGTHDDNITSRVGTTVALMETLSLERPAGTEFAICVGEDAYEDLIAGKWHRGEELLRDYTIIVAPRHGFKSSPERPNAPVLNVGTRRIEWLPRNITAPLDEEKPVSSTVIRHHLASRNLLADEDEIMSVLPPESVEPAVLRYILERGLYLRQSDTIVSDSGNADVTNLFATADAAPEVADPEPLSPKRHVGLFGSSFFGRRAPAVSTSAPDESSEASSASKSSSASYFSLSKSERSYVDAKDKNGLLAESRELVGREVDMYNLITDMVAEDEFATFLSMPYSLFHRAIRTELQNKPPGKTWTVSKANEYAKAALARMRMMMQWRDDNNISELLDGLAPEHESMHKHWPVFVHGRDAYGHPITCERPTEVNPAGLKARMGINDIMRHRMQMMEALEYYKSQPFSKDIHHKVYKQICIFDLEGFAMSFFTVEKKNFMVELVRILTHKYTDSLYLLYVVNTPMVFRFVWSVLQPILQPTTKSKIYIFGPSDKKKLAKQLAKHDIPLSSVPKCCGGRHEGRRMDVFITETLEMYKAAQNKK